MPFDGTPVWLDQGEDESGRTTLEDGHVFMSVIGPDANYWDYFQLPSAAGVIRVEAHGGARWQRKHGGWTGVRLRGGAAPLVRGRCQRR